VGTEGIGHGNQQSRIAIATRSVSERNTTASAIRGLMQKAGCVVAIERAYVAHDL
jgi:hypothetical protein